MSYTSMIIPAHGYNNKGVPGVGLLLRLSYDSSDPLVVTGDFAITEDDMDDEKVRVRWFYSREVMIGGLGATENQKAGTGDFKTWKNQGWYYLHLDNGDFNAVFHVKFSDMEKFLTSTVAIVALGDEYDEKQWDAALTILLGNSDRGDEVDD
jgi:hypothetical protein